MFAHMSWGKKNRLKQIVAPDGRTLMLAIDHGYFMGPTHGMEEPAKATAPLLPHIDSLMLSPGILTSSINPSIRAGIVLRASGGNTILDDDIDNEELILSAHEAIKLNASAIAVSIFIGADHQHQTLMNLAEAINDAGNYDLPVLAVTAVGKALKDRKDKRFLGLASRIAAEYGADLIKTYYCEGFEEVVAKCPVPIIIAGGPKLDTYRDVLQLCYDAIQRGAIGVDMGRNIWQSEHPAAIIQGVQGIIHQNLTVDEAHDLVQSLANDQTRRELRYEATPEDHKLNKVH
jgi:putative autoinducer-2 (AI-2) aldolase